jgi:hypothetical protein
MSDRMESIMITWLPLLLLAFAYALIISLEWRKGRRLEQSVDTMRSAIDNQTSIEGERLS